MKLTERGIEDEKGEIARADVVDASVIPHATDAGFSVVRVRRRGKDDRNVIVPDVETARRAVAHLGHAVADRPWRFVAESPVRLGNVLGGFVIFSPLIWVIRFFFAAPLHYVMLGWLLLSAITFLVLRMPVRGTIDLDGVAIRWLRFSRVVPLDAIADVTCEQKGGSWHEVRIDLRDQDDVHVYLAESDDAEIVAERVREALDAARLRTAPIVAPLLRPPSATARQWIDRLRAVGSGMVTHRDAPVEEEVLWGVVESAVARPTDRAAAAVALAITGTEAKARLRVVSSAVTQPRLRIALNAAAAADEPALEAALEEVDSAPPSSARPMREFSESPRSVGSLRRP